MIKQADIEKVFGKFDYEDLTDGLIRPDQSWIDDNIVTATIPVVNKIVCHRLILPTIIKIFTDLSEYQYLNIINVKDWQTVGGCFVPRHILFDKTKSLSRHAWGIAVDLNVAKNGYGKKPNQSPIIVDMFKTNGFLWGGDWVRINGNIADYTKCDGMHFEVDIPFLSMNKLI